jgi:glycosyltransferase involved in cell wall biosynthesis
MIGVCFSSKSSLKLWDELGIAEIEKRKIAQLMDVSKHDLLIINTHIPRSQIDLDKLKSLSSLYVPGPYALLVAISLKIYAWIILQKNLPIFIRFGYMPDILHFKNGRYYNAFKAEVLILFAQIFCRKLYVIHNFRKHLILRFSWKVEWIEQKVASETVHHKLIPTKEREFDFLFCGRLETEKGADALLNVNFERRSINIVGSGKYADQFKERFSGNYFPSMTQLELALIYSKTKFLLNLSPSEGSPKVVLEALLNGCTVIALSNSFEKFSGFEEQIIFFNSIAEIKHFIDSGTYLNESNLLSDFIENYNVRKVLIDRYVI